MKTLVATLLLFTAIIITSCEGPIGPPGIPGEDGADGLIGSVFEIEGDFTPQNGYKIFYQFPNNFEIYDGDIVLVYILWEQASTNNGPVDVWRLLPQTVALDDGILQYNFDYTLADVQVFLEGTTDFSNLLPAETNDQIFRIAVIPAAFAKSKSIDFSDFNAVMKSMNFNSNLIDKVNPTLKIN